MITPPNSASPTTAAAFQRLGAAPQGAAGQSSELAEAFGSAIEGVTDSLAEADELSRQVATGEITDLSQLTAASAKAELGVQLTVAFRDRAVASFQQIMQMQV